MTPAEKKTLRRAVMMTLAVIFLVEAWLWDHMGVAVARCIRALPFEKYRALLVEKLDTLTPTQTLGVFIIPVLLLLPFKFFALWLLAKGHLFLGILAVLAAKLAGLGVGSFLFMLCKPKLLQVRWVDWLYQQCLHWRHLAHAWVRPYTRFLDRYAETLRRNGKLGKLIARWRSRVQRGPSA